MIDHNIDHSGYWNSHKEYNPYIYNYYLNITFLSMVGGGIHLYVSKRRSRLAVADFREVRQSGPFFSLPVEGMEGRLVEILDTTSCIRSQ